MVALTFLGAAGTVTGSRYLLEAGDERMMIDCGLFQGQKELRLQNWAALPVDPRSIQWLVLTHAHLDHTGYIPRLVKQGFRGPIVASPATADLTKLLLLDSAYLQEEDAAYANKMGFSKHTPALPLYTHEDALQSIELFHVVDETKPLRLSSHFTLRFLRAARTNWSFVSRSHRKARIICYWSPLTVIGRILWMISGSGSLPLSRRPKHGAGASLYRRLPWEEHRSCYIFSVN